MRGYKNTQLILICGAEQYIVQYPTATHNITLSTVEGTQLSRLNFFE